MYVPQVEEMSLEDYLYKSVQKCWGCKNAYGGCPWTEVDPDTKRVKFQPIPGWEAKFVRRKIGSDNYGRPRYQDSYAIKSCPMFDPEEPRKLPTRGHAD